MIVRIAYFDALPQGGDAPEHGQFRAWLASQPGFVRAHHALNHETGAAVSISYWQSLEHLEALRSRTPPGGPLGFRPQRVETYEVEHEF